MSSSLVSTRFDSTRRENRIIFVLASLFSPGESLAGGNRGSFCVYFQPEIRLGNEEEGEEDLLILRSFKGDIVLPPLESSNFFVRKRQMVAEEARKAVIYKRYKFSREEHFSLGKGRRIESHAKFKPFAILFRFGLKRLRSIALPPSHANCPFLSASLFYDMSGEDAREARPILDPSSLLPQASSPFRALLFSLYAKAVASGYYRPPHPRAGSPRALRH